MPTMKEKLYFNFDGVWSDSLGLVSVSVDGGMFEETLVADRELNETIVRGSDKPLFHNIDNLPLQFNLTLAFTRGFSAETLDKIIRWLFVDHYKPLYFEGREERIYRCMPIGDASLVHNGIKQGFFTILMRCDASYLYSPRTLTNKINVVGTETITVTNNGHFNIYPEISLLKKGAGNIVIENLDDGNSIFEIRNLTNLEDIYIDCEREIVETDAVGIYRYSDVVGEFTRLLYDSNNGKNRLKITGNCEIQLRYENRYKM